LPRVAKQRGFTAVLGRDARLGNRLARAFESGGRILLGKRRVRLDVLQERGRRDVGRRVDEGAKIGLGVLSDEELPYDDLARWDDGRRAERVRRNAVRGRATDYEDGGQAQDEAQRE
jgi:hypothetical protein